MARQLYKSKLEKVLYEPEYTYETTVSDCEKWFRILNNEIFFKELRPINEIDIRWRRGAWAYYQGFYDTEDPSYFHSVLLMNRRYKSKKLFVEVLAHELVHHWQFMSGERPHHGASFMEWTDIFNKKGLKLGVSL